MVIGVRVLTIEVSTHADMGYMNMHCTAILGKARLVYLLILSVNCVVVIYNTVH